MHTFTTASSFIDHDENGRLITSPASRFQGRECEIIREVTEDEADIQEVGPMYVIRFDTGDTIEAFHDEIQ